jgi:putative colanic acid biosynthesis glycosyltransferase
MKSMKILFINSVIGIGSTGRIISDLVCFLAKQNCEAVVCYGRDEAPNACQRYSYKISSGLKTSINGIASRLLDKESFVGKSASKKVIQMIKSFQPDIIHINNLHGYYLDVETLFDYLKSFPGKIVWTMHDCWPLTGRCAIPHGCCELINGCHKCPHKDYYPKTLFSINSGKHYQEKKRLFTSLKNLEIVTPSEWLATIFKNSYLNKYHISVIKNGIDLNCFHHVESNFRTANALTNEKIVLGVASPFLDRKGLGDFIKLSEILPGDYKVVMVGLNDKQIKTLPKNIIKMPKTHSKKELAEIYSAADVFLNLTYDDNYPTVNLESQACGTPCITYRTGGSPESVPTENVVEVGDTNGVIKRIKEICDEPNKNLLVKKDIENLDANETSKVYLRLYEKILGN